MYIVRHSERLDEQVSSQEYETYINSKLLEGDLNGSQKKAVSLDPLLPIPYQHLYPVYQRRRNHHIYDDPPITARGVGIAELAGKSLRQLISHRAQELTSTTQPPVIHLYASRLLRCVQTAYAVAKQLQVDTMYISSGLALTAAAVERWVREEDSFDHLNMDEICSICHDMVIFDCDYGVVYDNRKHDITVLAKEPDAPNSSSNAVVETKVNDGTVTDGKRHEYHICKKNWHTAIQHISDHIHDINHSTIANFNVNHESNKTNNVCKVIVAHRETIRNLMNPYQRYRLPYCCIAELMLDTANVVEEVDQKKFALGKLFTPHGELMLDLTPEYMRISNNLSKL